MRFDRLNNDLPDDLSELAGQLTDDANRLAARYPARSHEPLEKAPRFSAWPRIAAAAVVLIAVGGITAAFIHPWNENRHQAGVLARTAPEDNLNPSGVQEVGFNLDPTKEKKLDETQMLRIQLNAFEQVIGRLQEQIAQHEKSETETQKLVESLQGEVKELHRRLDQRDAVQTH